MRANRRQVVAGLLASAGGLGIAGCAVNPGTGRRSFTGFYDVEDDRALGAREHPKLVEAFGGTYDDPDLARYVSDIGARVAAHAEIRDFEYRFTLLNSPVVNAFALPGGYCYCTRGLLALAANEAELAGVLAHETGHVVARHTAERMSSAMLAQLGAAVLGMATGSSDIARLGAYAGTAYVQSFSRQQEFEADTLGVRYMAKAGYDPDAMVTFLSTLRAHSRVEAQAMGLPPGTVDEFNIMSTHPRTTERVRAAVAQADAQRPADPVLNRAGYLARIDGMLYGDDPSEGQFLGRRFVHTGLRLEFTVPEGFRPRNQPDRVLATRADGAAMVFDMARRRRARDVLGYLDGEWTERGTLASVGRIEVNGLPAATGTARLAGRAGPLDARAVAIAGAGDTVYRFLFISPAQATAGLDAPFRRATYSFRLLSAEEAAAIRPTRLLVVPADGTEDAAAQGRYLPYGRYSGEAWRVLNDLEGGRAPSPGAPIKVIVA